MLKSLRLENFRCFEDHNLSFRRLTVMVGRNNAGKSTVVEALRLVALVVERVSGLTFRQVPEWLDLPKIQKGVVPSTKNLAVNFRGIFYRYGEPPARITAVFDGGSRLELNIGPNESLFANFFDADGVVVSTRGRLRDLDFADVRILPQVAPVDHTETILTDEHVRANLSTTLSPRHFRNQLRLMNSEYLKFRRLAEESWPGIRIVSLEGARGQHGEPLNLIVQDTGFAAGSSGFRVGNVAPVMTA